MKIYSIYKATCKSNGKIYIGFDSRWPKRQIEHKSSAFLDKDNRHFHNAIRKYGWDDFEWEVICQSLDGNHLLKKMETYFINKYDSFNTGYNLTLGGEGTLGLKVSNETRYKMSIARKGIKLPPMSEETKMKISSAKIGYKRNVDNCIQQSETMKDGRQLGSRNNNAKKILIHTKYGKVSFGSISDAIRGLNINVDLYYVNRVCQQNNGVFKSRKSKYRNFDLITKIERVV